MSRLPNPGGDVDQWGIVLNDYLQVVHDADGNLKNGLITKAKLDTTTQASLTKADGALQASNNLSDVTNAVASLNNLGGVTALTAVAVQTGAFTATVNQIAPVDASGGAVSVTLPTAPADKARLVIKKIDNSTNTVTITAGGSDTFNKSGGLTSVVLSVENQSINIQYRSASSVWYVVNEGLPLSALDSRYAPVIATQLKAWAYGQLYQLVTVNRDANEAIITASVVWPDGANGTFTTDTASTSFPGAIDAYHVTYNNGAILKTITQPAVTRDAAGAITAQPAITLA